MIKKSLSLTKEGKKELEDELAKLIKERPEITERIATAREFGDLSENEEYSSARNEQKLAESRIQEIEEILKNAEIIRSSKKSKVGLGVTVSFTMDGDPKEYTIVGTVEADPSSGKISDESPIGKELIGHAVGDKFKTAAGKEVEILEIK